MLYHEILLLQKYNDVLGKVLKPQKKEIRLFFSFLIVSNCMVYPDPKLLIPFKYQKSRVRIYHTIRHNQHKQTLRHKVNNFDFCFV